MQATRVKIIRFEIRGGDKTHAVFKQSRQEAVQDHGVGNVRDVELIKTNEFITLSHALSQCIERVDGTLQISQLAVHFAHELMKMQPCLSLQRHCVEKAIHQKAFTPPNPAVHVDTPGNVWPVNQLFKCVGPLFLVLRPFIGASLQSLNRPKLRGVRLKPAAVQLALIGGLNALHH